MVKNKIGLNAPRLQRLADSVSRFRSELERAGAEMTKALRSLADAVSRHFAKCPNCKGDNTEPVRYAANWHRCNTCYRLFKPFMGDHR